MAADCLPAVLALWISDLAWPLHGRNSWRLAPLLTGMLFAQGRQTVASWLRAAGVGKDFRRFYYFIGSVGHNTKWVAGQLLTLVLQQVVRGERVLFAIDDTHTKRYGPHVEGAGVHHNPTPGPAEQTYVYGHVFVTLALLVSHPLWGTIGLPILSMLYVRQKDLGKLPPWYKFPFETKLQKAAEMVEWVAERLRWLNKSLWIVVDGGYVKRPFLKRALAAGATIVGRLRCDAALCDVPDPNEPKRRGRPRKYGKGRINLAMRAGQTRGWQIGEFLLYGQPVTKTFKTFLATYRPVGGLIRVVLIKETTGWIALFCTDPNATVAQILEAYANRSAIEQVFHDIKEVHGAGKQQLRYLWANLGAFNLCLWMHTLIELWAWTKSHPTLCDRRRSPWDDPTRRPSHADRRNALRRACIKQQINCTNTRRPIPQKIKNLLNSVVSLVA